VSGVVVLSLRGGLILGAAPQPQLVFYRVASRFRTTNQEGRRRGRGCAHRGALHSLSSLSASLLVFTMSQVSLLLNVIKGRRTDI